MPAKRQCLLEHVDSIVERDQDRERHNTAVAAHSVGTMGWSSALGEQAVGADSKARACAERKHAFRRTALRLRHRAVRGTGRQHELLDVTFNEDCRNISATLMPASGTRPVAASLRHAMPTRATVSATKVISAIVSCRLISTISSAPKR